MKVLALKSKHSTEYFDAANENAAFLAAFRFNDELTCYGDLSASESKDAEKDLAALQELKADLDAGKVSKALMREAARQVEELPKAERYIESLKRQVELYKRAKKGDGAAAKLLFQYRNDYEYEGWEIIYIQKPHASKKKR